MHFCTYLSYGGVYARGRKNYLAIISKNRQSGLLFAVQPTEKL